MGTFQIEKFTIARNDTFMEGWPDMIKLQSGRILVFYNECTAHSNRNGTHITMRSSEDEGFTWSEKTYIGEETNHGDQWNSIRVNQLKNGKIILICDRIAQFEKSAETKFYTFESTDDGNSWSEKYDIGVYGYCSDKVRELSDGSLLLCVSRYNADTSKSEILAHKSMDGGRTWSFVSMVAASEQYTFIEPAALELRNGKVVVFIREDSKLGYNGFAAFSEDLGCSYQDLQQIPVKGMHRPFVGYLVDGNIFLSYREHLSSKNKYMDLKMCTFSENAILHPESMQVECVSVDHDRNENPDTGYTAWVCLNDGTILMANYIVDDAPKAYIRGYRIKKGEENNA